MNCFALWRRLDTPGHDAAHMSQTGDGWRLRGTAVFMHEAGPASLGYTLDLEADWKTRRARIQGFLGSDRIDQTIARGEDGWTVNGDKAEDFAHLVDLDLGFTPATNFQQLRRIALVPGEAADVSVAWLDAGAAKLVELPQRYERRSGKTYWYEAPSVGYEAMLEMTDDGFIALYPHLWEIEGR